MRASRKPMVSPWASGRTETSTSRVRETPTQVPCDGGAELGAGVDADDDAVVVEGDVGLFGVDEAGGFGVAAQVVATVGGVEELGAEGALEGLGGDADLGGAGAGGEGAEDKGADKQGAAHCLRIMGG